MTDTLQELLELQDHNQTYVYGDGTSPADYDDERKIEFIKTNVLAATDELHELLGEVGWKPWASSRHINLEKARGEFIDVLHFVNNLAIALGLDAVEVRRRYLAKSETNVARQAAGYDGVSTKCPRCKRALDDEAVACYLAVNDSYYCDTDGLWVDAAGKEATL